MKKPPRRMPTWKGYMELDRSDRPAYGERRITVRPGYKEFLMPGHRIAHVKVVEIVLKRRRR